MPEGTHGYDDRPSDLPGVSQRIKTGWGKVYVNINVNDAGEPFEVFVNIGESGGLYNAQGEALGKALSNGLRAARDKRGFAYAVADDLIGIRTDRVAEDNGDTITSIPDALGVALLRFLDEKFDPPESVKEDVEMLP